MRRGLLVGALVASALCGCSREHSLTCQSAERYATARSVPPVRVPDDLTVPDETDSLRLPPEPAPWDSGAAERCLEAPPDFFRNRPGSTQPGAEPQASEPAAEDPDRRIDN